MTLSFSVVKFCQIIFSLLFIFFFINHYNLLCFKNIYFCSILYICPDLVNLRERYEKIHSPPPVSPGPDSLNVYPESPYSSPTGSCGRTPSPPTEQTEEDNWSSNTRVRTVSDRVFGNVNDEELVAMFKETEALEEQGDILHYLVGNR